MKEKIYTFIWFCFRPTFYLHALELFLRKFRKNNDSEFFIEQATLWAEQKTVSVQEALKIIGLRVEGDVVPSLNQSLMNEAYILAKNSKVEMGGAGDINLIYAATLLSKSTTAIETGVAYGWSSLSILAGLQEINSSILVSVDMPYPKMNNEKFVGIVIPDNLRKKWHLVRQPDRRGIKKAISKINGPIDICHYDSDKTYHGRSYGYPLLWTALKKGGIFISDDIQDNLAFKEFVELKGISFAITQYKGKYIGITKK